MKGMSLALVAIVFAACSTTPKAPPAAAAAKPAAAATAATQSSVAGNWSLAIQTPMGTRDSTLVLAQNGNQLSGTMQSPRGEVPINGTIKGSEIAFSMKLNVQGADMNIDYSGTVQNDSMQGKVVLGQMGEGTWTGKRK
jgi:invasion protein IalB